MVKSCLKNVTERYALILQVPIGYIFCKCEMEKKAISFSTGAESPALSREIGDLPETGGALTTNRFAAATKFPALFESILAAAFSGRICCCSVAVTVQPEFTRDLLEKACR